MKNFIELKEGQRVWFEGERFAYTVRASDKQFVICTKPFNLKQTVIYTIINHQRKVRGTENLIFCMGFETDSDCKDALHRLISGESEVSYRNYVQLKIDKVK